MGLFGSRQIALRAPTNRRPPYLRRRRRGPGAAFYAFLTVGLAIVGFAMISPAAENTAENNERVVATAP